MRRKSPQEKKQLSYSKDRRNNYGENAKSSRRAIPRRKAQVNRVNRRADQQSLSRACKANPVSAEALQDSVESRRRKHWRKCPGYPLGLYLADRMRRRIGLGMCQQISDGLIATAAKVMLDNPQYVYFVLPQYNSARAKS